MALDERQQRIKEGAGLEESRLNVEFIDWVRRWSTPALAVVAAVVLAYLLYERWQQSRQAEIGRAFSQLDALTASLSPSPDSLKALAEEFAGIRGVPHIARLRAADIYLQAARRGVKPGAALTPEGTPRDPADLLTDEARERTLAEAQRLYQMVWDATRPDRGQALHAIGAGYGLAAVAECRGDTSGAADAYKRVIGVATEAGLAGQAEIARARAESLSTLHKPRLFSAAELPKLPWADELKPPTAPQTETPTGGGAPAEHPGEPAPRTEPAPSPVGPEPVPPPP